MPELKAPEGLIDFHFIEAEEPEAIQDLIVRLVKERIAGRMNSCSRTRSSRAARRGLTGRHWMSPWNVGIPIGGHLPRGRKDENGDVLPDKYANMQETDTDDVNVRTELNVQNSDATLSSVMGAFRRLRHTRNAWPESMGSPACMLTLTNRIPIRPCCLSRHGCSQEPGVLNVAGPRAER